MGTYRKRVKTKGKRWVKGQSSNSNPSCSTFRNSAANNFFNEVSDGAATLNYLTADSIRKHDDLFSSSFSKENENKNNDVSDCNSELTSFDGTLKTVNTFATDWSCCTNLTFSKLLNRFDLTSAHHKEMLAVLAAITEVIKSNGGKETTTEYFAALLTTLETVNDEQNEDSLNAILSLLLMCIKRVPREVLQSKFSSISKTLLERLKSSAESNNNIILKSLLACISVLLRAQDPSVWRDSSTFLLYDCILSFIVHSKSKIRKAAQHSVCAVLKGSDFLKDKDKITVHPASGHTAKYCIKIIESSISGGGTTTILHLLVLLKEIIAVFPKQQLKTCCESILKLMTLKNPLVTTCGLQTLHGLFVSKPNVTSCPITLNAQLISALYDYQPAVTDVQLMCAWATVMQEAFINLAKNDLSLCMLNVPKLFRTLVPALLCEKLELRNNITLIMQTVLKDCVGPSAADETKIDEYKPLIQNVFDVLSGCLKYQYHSAWKHTFFLLSTMYKICGRTCHEFMTDCLQSLADMRNSDDFPYENEVDQIFGSAIESMGPQFIIEKVPLQVVKHSGSNYEIKGSWLLPLLRQHIKQSTIRCFVDRFLPIASYFRQKQEALSKLEDKTGTVGCELLQSQIWALLPSFCDSATDVAETFPTVAKNIGDLLSTRPDLRTTVLATLRKLIQNTKSNEKDAAVVARFAKNYLPILFNLYTTESKKTDEAAARVSAYETIKVYLKIADTTIVEDLFKKALDKLESEKSNENDFIRESILDLIRILLPYQSIESLKLLFEDHIKKIKNPKNFKEEKKYYRLLETLCSSESESCKEFIKNNFSRVKSLLSKTITKAALTSRGPRIRTMKALLNHDSGGKTIISFIPEAVMCCKDGNARCRSCAFELITKMTNLVMENYGESGLGKYLDKLCAGLVGTTTTIAATILALSTAVYTCRKKMHEQQFDAILRNICLLSQSKTREIVGPALGFLQVVISSKNHQLVLAYLTLIVKTLSGLSDDCKRKFRQKIRYLLEKLAKNYGASTIISLVPTHDGVTIARLKALRKEQNRKLKKKLEQTKLKRKKKSSVDAEAAFNVKRKPKTMEEILAECDDDDDVEMGGEVSDSEIESIRKNKSSQPVYLKEDEDSIIDFTSPSANKNITSVRPVDSQTSDQVKTQKKKENEFPTAPDGRLIILENKSEKSVPKRDTNFDEESIASDAEAEAESKISQLLSNVRLSRKRKNNDADENVKSSKKYQAGGSGIHRKIKKNSKINSAEEYKAKKAKGDCKKKGKPDPYAYIPLSRNALKRKYR